MSSDENHPYRNYPAYRRVINEILEVTDRQDGLPPRERTFTGLTTEDVRQLRVAFWPNHLTEKGAGRVKVHIHRIIRDLYDGDESRATGTWYSLLNREPRRLRQEETEKYTRLIKIVEGMAPTRGRDHLLDFLKARRGWPRRLVEKQGLEGAQEEIQAFMRVIERLPCAEPTRLRAFSAQCLGDSKRLDPGSPLYRRVSDFLEDATDPVTIESLDDERQSRSRRLFEEMNLLETFTSSTVLAHGPLTLRFPDGVINQVVHENSRYGLSTLLTLEQLRTCAVQTTASQVVTIENETSFVDFCKASPPNVLSICTRGQPNAAVKTLLRSLPLEIAAQVTHWGDIDAGGFRILGQLNRLVGARPIFMDRATIERFRDRLTPADESKRQSILKYLQTEDPGNPALEACLEYNGWLEQEAIPASELLGVVGVLASRRSGKAS